jgi:hypothetical protein
MNSGREKWGKASMRSDACMVRRAAAAGKLDSPVHIPHELLDVVAHFQEILVAHLKQAAHHILVGQGVGMGMWVAPAAVMTHVTYATRGSNHDALLPPTASQPGMEPCLPCRSLPFSSVQPVCWQCRTLGISVKYK